MMVANLEEAREKKSHLIYAFIKKKEKCTRYSEMLNLKLNISPLWAIFCFKITKQTKTSGVISTSVANISDTNRL